jgi:hypothetical protein
LENIIQLQEQVHHLIQQFLTFESTEIFDIGSRMRYLKETQAYLFSKERLNDISKQIWKCKSNKQNVLLTVLLMDLAEGPHTKHQNMVY